MHAWSYAIERECTWGVVNCLDFAIITNKQHLCGEYIVLNMLGYGKYAWALQCHTSLSIGEVGLYVCQGEMNDPFLLILQMWHVTKQTMIFHHSLLTYISWVVIINRIIRIKIFFHEKCFGNGNRFLLLWSLFFCLSIF